ncbi:hypothetical protein THMIRHAM_19930 [Thiomicrorhabdus immobilis]|uniref:Lipoprotein n=1 Tax=Thiomicrorhabdus immobilis TaxID=2791037 RepID=A0ABN6CYN6_9GAMM|nr:hypothetical protein [Thiomicrorhabdus immobilis]BCN94208.1 hypothetical protein THMIRHAM_19930 [Thiomicrorhabdus immobilis]
MKTQTLTLLFSLLVTGLLLQGCSQSEQSSVNQWPTPKTCDLHTESCTAKMGDSTITLKISPHPIPIARPLGIEVDVTNLDVQKIELDISGINMYMGYNRVTLTQASADRYIGTSMLAFCTNQKMLWQVTLMIHQKDGTQIQIPYTLETINRR